MFVHTRGRCRGTLLLLAIAAYLSSTCAFNVGRCGSVELRPVHTKHESSLPFSCLAKTVPSRSAVTPIRAKLDSNVEGCQSSSLFPQSRHKKVLATPTLRSTSRFRGVARFVKSLLLVAAFVVRGPRGPAVALAASRKTEPVPSAIVATERNVDVGAVAALALASVGGVGLAVGSLNNEPTKKARSAHRRNKDGEDKFNEIMGSTAPVKHDVESWSQYKHDFIDTLSSSKSKQTKGKREDIDETRDAAANKYWKVKFYEDRRHQHVHEAPPESGLGVGLLPKPEFKESSWPGYQHDYLDSADLPKSHAEEFEINALRNEVQQLRALVGLEAIAYQTTEQARRAWENQAEDAERAQKQSARAQASTEAIARSEEDAYRLAKAETRAAMDEKEEVMSRLEREHREKLAWMTEAIREEELMIQTDIEAKNQIYEKNEELERARKELKDARKAKAAAEKEAKRAGAALQKALSTAKAEARARSSTEAIAKAEEDAYRMMKDEVRRERAARKDAEARLQKAQTGKWSDYKHDFVDTLATAKAPTMKSEDESLTAKRASSEAYWQAKFDEDQRRQRMLSDMEKAAEPASSSDRVGDQKVSSWSGYKHEFLDKVPKDDEVEALRHEVDDLKTLIEVENIAYQNAENALHMEEERRKATEIFDSVLLAASKNAIAEEQLEDFEKKADEFKAAVEQEVKTVPSEEERKTWQWWT